MQSSSEDRSLCLVARSAHRRFCGAPRRGGECTGSRSRRVACVGRLPQPKLRYTPKKLFNFISAHPFIGDDTLCLVARSAHRRFCGAPRRGGECTGSRSRHVACVGRLPQPKLRYTPKSYSILFPHIPSSGTMPYCATPRKELFVCHGRAPERRPSRTALRSERLLSDPLGAYVILAVPARNVNRCRTGIARRSRESRAGGAKLYVYNTRAGE